MQGASFNQPLYNAAPVPVQMQMNDLLDMDDLSINDKQQNTISNPLQNPNEFVNEDLQKRSNSINSNVQQNFPAANCNNVKIPYCVRIPIIYKLQKKIYFKTQIL